MRPSEASCPPEPELLAYVQGELPRAARESLRRHIGGCTHCRKDVAGWIRVLTAAAHVPGLPPHPDLAQSILASLPPEAWTPAPTPAARAVAALLGVAAAALVLLLLMVAAPVREAHESLLPRPPAVDAGLARGAAFLVRRQSQDGSWRPFRERMERLDEEGLTALCLAILCRQNLDNGHYRQAVDRARQRLMQQQKKSGLLGGGSLRQHLFCIWALLRLYHRRPWKGLEPALQKALHYLLVRQEPDGSFKGPRALAERPISNTLWALEVLRLGRQTGFKIPQDALQRARAWGRAVLGRSEELEREPRLLRMALRSAAGEPLADDFRRAWSPDSPLEPLLILLLGHALGPKPMREVAQDLLDQQTRAGPRLGAWPSRAKKPGSPDSMQKTTWSLLVLDTIKSSGLGDDHP